MRHKLRRAQEVFAAVADSFTTRKLLYNSMIDACIKCAKPEEAYLLYRDEAEKGHDLGAVAISMLVNVLTNCGKNDNSKKVILFP
ncbi:unnamed protein product [Ilex paraguariensis]|uniref:Uncharacterized protein n=1 Tax=Ilex paraguariensis TaxID=185542 RepID=A0ABC8TTD7_9AQUA